MDGYEQLMLASQGHVAFQMLNSACELEVFELLGRQGTASLEEVAAGLGLPLQSARVLMRGLSSLGLISGSDRGYALLDAARRYLVRSSPHNIIDVLLWQKHIVYQGLTNFTDSLRAGENLGLRHFPGDGATLYERLRAHPEKERAFQTAMERLSQIANDVLVEQLASVPSGTIADLGGGNGSNLIRLCRQHPGLQGIVVDNESVCRMAQQKIAGEGLSDRIRTVACDFLEDELPSGVDVFLFSHIFTIYSMEKNVQLLNKAYRQLPTGGKVLIFNMAANEDEISPLSCTLGSAYFLAVATGEGMLYSIRDYRRMIEQSEFTRCEIRSGLELDHILIELTKV